MDPDFLRELFEPIGPVTLRRMFGGQGVFQDGTMFALVLRGELYLKTGTETRARFEAAGSEPFSYERRGTPVETSYWRVPPEALEHPDEMTSWARLVLSVVRPTRKRRTRA